MRLLSSISGRKDAPHLGHSFPGPNGGARLSDRPASRTLRQTQGAAFTLLEIMIAMTILGFVLTAVYSSWSAVVRASKVGLDAAAQVQRTRISIRTLVDALLTVQMFGANANLYAFEADTSGDYASISFVSHLPDSFPDAGLFGDQTVRRVTFNVEPGREAGNQLVMYQTPLLATEDAGQKPFPIVLARGVSLFTLDFWDAQAGKWLTEWNNTNQLPKMVRVSLGFGKTRNFGQPEELYTRVVSMPSMVIPREFQMGVAGGPRGAMPPGGRPGPGGAGIQVPRQGFPTGNPGLR